MLPRGKRNVLRVVLVLALLFAAAPGWAAQRRSPVTSGWGKIWQRVVVWVAETASPGLRVVWDKTTSMIDPNGQQQAAPPPASTVQSDTSAGIDPNGRH